MNKMLLYKKIKEKEANTKIEMKLLDGKLVFMGDFILLKETVTKNANYAGVIAEKKGTLPHFIFLSEKPINKLKPEEEEKIFDLCCKAYPRAAFVREKEVEAIFDAEGRLLNTKAWMKSPRLGIFGVLEVENENSLFLGTGIIRGV